MTEKEILEKYSSPGLRRNQLDRSAKKNQLEGMGVREPRLSEILDELYGPE